MVNCNMKKKDKNVERNLTNWIIRRQPERLNKGKLNHNSSWRAQYRYTLRRTSVRYLFSEKNIPATADQVKTENTAYRYYVK